MLEEQSAQNVQKKRVDVTPGTNKDPEAGFEAAREKARKREPDAEAARRAAAPRGASGTGGGGPRCWRTSKLNSHVKCTN